MKKYVAAAISVTALAVVLSVTLLQNNTGACLLIGVTGVVILFFALFEAKRVVVEKIVLVALLSSLAAAGRVLFAAIPSVQPASFLIIVSGIVFGGEVGFITGAVTALASNLLLGQGPWTVWQMFTWGMMGCLSALLAKPLLKSRALLVTYGLLWGFVFGWVMNSWFVFGGYLEEYSAAAVLVVYAASFPMDLAHGVANALLLAALGKSFIRIFGRVSRKYGLSQFD